MPPDSDRDDNPYAPPQSDVVEGSLAFTAAKMERKCLVVPRVWQSPPVCLLSGGTEDLIAAKPVRRVAVLPVIGLLLLSVVIAAGGNMAVPLILLAGSFACTLLPGGPSLFRLVGRADIHWFLTAGMARRRRWQLRIRLLMIAATMVLPQLFRHNSSLYVVSLFVVALAGLTKLIVPDFLTVRITADTVSFLGLPEEVMEIIVQLDLSTKTAAAAAGRTGSCT